LSAIVFSLAVIIFLIIGAAGPRALDTGTMTSDVVFDSNGDATVLCNVNDLEPGNRMLYMTMSVHRNVKGPSVSEDFDLHVSLVASDPFSFTPSGDSPYILENRKEEGTLAFSQGDLTSDNIFVYGLRQLYYSSYNSTVVIPKSSAVGITSVEMKHITINPAYTAWEMGWLYFFLIVTLGALFLPQVGYLARLKLVPSRQWTREQTWVLVLLELLVLFNDPFFAAQVYSSNGEGLSVLYIFFLATFLSVLLAFVITVLDDILIESRRDFDDAPLHVRVNEQWYSVYLPKLVLCGVIWLLVVVTFVRITIKAEGDPTYGMRSDSSMHSALVALIVFMSFYIILLAVLLVRNAMSYSTLKVQYQFLFTLTAFVVIVTIAGIFIGSFQPVRASASAGTMFMTFHPLLNLYVWMLAFVYSPVESADQDDQDLLSDEQSRVLAPGAEL